MCVVDTGWLVHRGGARASSSIKWDFIQGGPRLSDFCIVFFYLPDLQNKPPLTVKAPFDLLKLFLVAVYLVIFIRFLFKLALNLL